MQACRAAADVVLIIKVVRRSTTCSIILVTERVHEGLTD
jgi:hypothetical protein